MHLWIFRVGGTEVSAKGILNDYQNSIIFYAFKGHLKFGMN